MTPIKIFLNIRDWLLAEEALTEIQAADALHHPELLYMTLRQLADLPLPGHFREAAHLEERPLAKCA